MYLRDDERGQAIQVGAVLLFAALIVAFSTYQAFVVPDQNRKIEFSHNQRVQAQFQDLRNAIVSVPGGGSGPSVSLSLGTQYPDRLVALNPGPPTGTLRTAGTTNPAVNASLRNATADGETADFWDGRDHNYTTGSLVYQPNYNLYTRAPRTVYESSVLFNQYRERNLSLTGQRLVSDRRINLVTLNGSLSVTRSTSLAVDVEALSTSTRTVSVTNASDGSNVTLAVPTRYNASVWRDLLSAERVANGGHVYNVTTEPIPDSVFDRLLVRLEPGVRYSVRTTRVGVGTGTQTPEEAYLTTVAGDGSAVPEESTQQLVVEVRDRFNNPVSGVSVRAGTDRGDSSLRPNSETTDEDGRVTFTYEAPEIDGSPKTDRVNASFTVDPNRTDFDPERVENVTFDLSVQNTDGSGTGTGGGGGLAYATNWQSPGGLSNVDCSTDPCELDAGSSRSARLTMETVPTAVGATVEYAVNNSTVGTVSPGTGETNSTGENQTTLTVQENGSINVYTASGGDGDVLTFEVLGVRLATVAYIADGSGDLNVVASDGIVTTYRSGTAEQIRALGPRTDVDDDGLGEIPYVNNANELKLVDEDGEIQTVADDAVYSGATVGVGDGDGDSTTELYYTGTNNGYLREVELGGSSQRLETTSGNNCNGSPSPIETSYGAAGVADYNNDGNQNVVFVDGNDKVAYYDPVDCNTVTTGAPVEVVGSGNGGVGIGAPFEYASGDVRVPVVNGSNALILVENDGTQTTVQDGYFEAAPSPTAVRDWNGDGDLEVVHLEGSSSPYALRYVGIDDTTLVTVRDEDGNPVEGQRTGGAR